MKHLSSRSAFFRPRLLLSFFVFLVGMLLGIVAFAVSSTTPALAQRPLTATRLQKMARPDVVELKAFSEDRDLHALPVIPPNEERDEVRLRRHPLKGGPLVQDRVSIVARRSAITATMPGPALVFNGVSLAESGCGCVPPDTQGDVGPNHFMQSVNSGIKIFSKAGGVLLPFTSYNSFFSGLSGGGTPCGVGQNDGDGYVFYDQTVNRWVVSDFAFPGFPGSSFYQCIGVSKTADPVSGGWWLYALQVDPSNPSYLGDYPKFALWQDGWYLTMNMFSNNSTFNGVRVYALNRAQMINGTGSPNPNAVGFTIDPATLGDSYSLVPATFRVATPPASGLDEYLLAIDSPAAGVLQSNVHVWRMHTDFATPANSTLGIGANHAFNANIAVDSFTDAYTSTTYDIVPQPDTTTALDTLGDKIMTPVVYTNFNGTESLWATHTINNNQNGTGPSAVRWYQFNVTGNSVPATAAQQQTFDNGADGIWRFMPSIAVDAAGDVVLGYSASSSTVAPSIRWAGRLSSDPASTLGQGEAVMQAGGGPQTSASRWGDYSYTNIDPVDNLTFWHTNEYFSSGGFISWNTSIGKFRFSSAPVALSAVSRKTHGGQGAFDIPLPLTGTAGIEDRSGATPGSHQIIATFTAPVTVASASASPANTDSFSVSGSQVTVNLSGVPDASRINVVLTNVNDGNASGTVTIPVSFLLGDANGDGVVNAGDATVTRNASGQNTSATNFRADLNADGTVNAADATIARNNSGNFIPMLPMDEPAKTQFVPARH